jgi:hypothetical protein
MNIFDEMIPLHEGIDAHLSVTKKTSFFSSTCYILRSKSGTHLLEAKQRSKTRITICNFIIGNWMLKSEYNSNEGNSSSSIPYLIFSIQATSRKDGLVDIILNPFENRFNKIIIPQDSPRTTANGKGCCDFEFKKVKASRVNNILKYKKKWCLMFAKSSKNHFFLSVKHPFSVLEAFVFCYLLYKQKIKSFLLFVNIFSFLFLFSFFSFC